MGKSGEQGRGASSYRREEEIGEAVVVLHWLRVGGSLLLGQKEIIFPLRLAREGE